MLVINFGHPLAPAAAQKLAEMIGEFDTRTVRVQLDMAAPLAPQVGAVVDEVGLSPDEWQTTAFVVVLPGATVAAGILLAEIHGRSGGFPRVVSMVSGADRVFLPSEVIDLQGVRNDARTRR